MARYETVDAVLDAAKRGLVYLGDDLRRDGETLAAVTHYTGRCERCGMWVGERTIMHGLPICKGHIAPRRRTEVAVWVVGTHPIMPRAWRKATPAERKTLLATASLP